MCICGFVYMRFSKVDIHTESESRMGTPPAQHERLTEASSKLREPILICPDALESSETIFSASIFLGFFPHQISCQREL